MRGAIDSSDAPHPVYASRTNGSAPAWRPATRRPPCHCTGARNLCLNRVHVEGLGQATEKLLESSGQKARGLPSSSSRNLLDRYCHAIALCLPCVCDAFAMRLPCVCHAFAMRLPCGCHAVAMRLPCVCHAIAMRFPCVCHASAMRLSCVCHTFAMVLALH